MVTIKVDRRDTVLPSRYDYTIENGEEVCLTACCVSPEEDDEIEDDLIEITQETDSIFLTVDEAHILRGILTALIEEAQTDVE